MRDVSLVVCAIFFSNEAPTYVHGCCYFISAKIIVVLPIKLLSSVNESICYMTAS